MINKIKGYGLGVVAVLTFLAPAVVPAAVQAAGAGPGCSGATGNSIAQGANLGSGSSVSCTGTDGVTGGSIASDARKVVTIFSVIVGAISVIMIIYGGFRYITSGGDSGRVGNAKNTLIYAIVGLVIVALAQLIVHFVLQQTSSVTTQT